MKKPRFPKSHTARRSLAYHEAGHAVVAWLTGSEIAHVSIIASDHGDGHVRARGHTVNEILISFAGGESQNRLGDDVERIAAAVEDDLQIAYDLVDTLSPDPDEQFSAWLFLRHRAKSMVEKNWELVRSLAEELLR